MMFVMMMFQWRMAGPCFPRSYKEDIVGRIYDNGFEFDDGVLDTVDAL